MSTESTLTTTMTANRVIIIGRLDTMRVRDYDGKREKQADGTTKLAYKDVTYQERRTPGLGGQSDEIAIQVLSPYGGMFGMRIQVAPRVRGIELLTTAAPDTLLAFEGFLQLKKTFDPRFARTQTDGRGRLDRGLQTRALQLQVTGIREPDEAERDAASAVWLEGVVGEPPRVSRHPEQPTIQLASTILHIAYARPANFPGLAATVQDTIEVNITIPTNHPDGEKCYRAGNRVRIAGQLDCYMEGRGGEVVQAKLAELDTAWVARQVELAAKPDALRNAERTYRRTRLQFEDTPRLSVLAGAVELLEGAPQTLAESYTERRAFVRQRRAEAAARRQRWEHDQARRAGAGGADAGPVTFAEVVEETVRAVSPAIAPPIETLPPRQQRPRRRGIEARSDHGNGHEQGNDDGNGNDVAHADAVVGDMDQVSVDGTTSAGVLDASAGAAADSSEPTLVVAGDYGGGGDDAGAV